MNMTLAQWAKRLLDRVRAGEYDHASPYEIEWALRVTGDLS